MGNTAHPLGGSSSRPVTPVANGSVTYIDINGIDTTGQTVVSAADAANLLQGVFLVNESADSGLVSDAVDGTFMVLPPVANNLYTPIPIPGNGPVYVKSSANTINISGYMI